MKPSAIVYTSNTGFTEQYAWLLGRRTNLPVCSLQEAGRKLPAGTPIVYLGWIQASHVKGFAAAKRRFRVCAVCGVGLCDTGTMLEEVRRATRIPQEIPLFTLQGGLDRARLRGLNALVISMLARGLSEKAQRTAQDERMLALLQCDAGYVSEAHLAQTLAWMQSA